MILRNSSQYFSQIKARTKVCQILASEGLDVSLWQNGNQNSSYSTADLLGTNGFDTFPEKAVDGDIPEASEMEDKMLLIRKRADKAVEDLVREKKRSNDLKEKLLEESQKRNQYLEALLRIKCLKYNQTFEELIKD